MVVFFLLLVALPAGSYFYLHRSLVAQYEVLAQQVYKDARQVKHRRLLTRDAGQLRSVRASHRSNEAFENSTWRAMLAANWGVTRCVRDVVDESGVTGSSSTPDEQCELPD